MLNRVFVLSVLVLPLCLPHVSKSENHDWPAYGKSAGGGNFSIGNPQINLENVDLLEQV